MKRDELGLLAAIFVVVLIVLACTTGCTSTEHVRLDKDPGALATEAGCAPLPVCEIPPAANSTQLTSALWACVLEYRALYSVCYHMAHPLFANPGTAQTCFQDSVPGAPVNCVPLQAIPAEVF